MLLTTAWATSAGDAAPCPPLLPDPLVPLVGDVVPPDVQPVVAIDSCTSIGFALIDEQGVDVAFTLESPFPGMQRIVPDAPLAPGLYTLASPASGYTYYYGQGAIPWFTVADDAAPTVPQPAELTAEFDYSCGDFTILEAYADLAFPDADPAQRGLVVLVPSVDGLQQIGPAPIAYAGEPVVELASSLPGGRELCVKARFEDLAGELAWETEEVCGPPPDCPSELGDDGDAEGCGCGSTGGGGGALGAALALLGLARRRR